MDKILEMIGHWHPAGQGIFFFLIFVVSVAAILQLFDLFIVLFRGWPPEDNGEKEEEMP